MNELIPLTSIDEEIGMPDPKSRHFMNKDEAVVDDNASTDDSVEEEEQYDGYADVEKMEVIFSSIFYYIFDFYITLLLGNYMPYH